MLSFLFVLKLHILIFNETGRRYFIYKITNFSIAHCFNTLVFAPFVYCFKGRINSGNFSYCLYSWWIKVVKFLLSWWIKAVTIFVNKFKLASNFITNDLRLRQIHCDFKWNCAAISGKQKENGKTKKILKNGSFWNQQIYKRSLNKFAIFLTFLTLLFHIIKGGRILKWPFKYTPPYA